MPTTYDIIKRLVREKGWEYAPRYAIVVVCMLLVAATTSLSAYMLKYVVNTIFVNQNRAALIGITFGIVAIFVAKGLAAYFSEVILGNIGNSLVADTQKRMFDHMMKVDVAFFQQYSSSELVTMMSYNANAVREMLTMVSLNLGRDLFTIIGLIITMITLDPVLSAIALVGGPIGHCRHGRWLPASRRRRAAKFIRSVASFKSRARSVKARRLSNPSNLKTKCGLGCSTPSTRSSGCPIRCCVLALE